MISLRGRKVTAFAACLLALCWLAAPLPAQPQDAAQRDIVILLSSDTAPYQEVVAGIQSVLQQSGLNARVSILDAEGSDSSAAVGDSDFVVAVGARATQYALKQVPSAQVCATFVTRSSLLSGHASSDQTNGKFPKQPQHAIVLDQPASRIVALARLIVPQARHLGTVVNGSAPHRLDEFSAAVNASNLQLQAATLFDESNPVKDLKQVFAGSDVFVVIPDKSRFNSKIAKWVLFLSYRQRVPVIGYSRKYTDAGALISLYSSPFQIGRDTAERLPQILAADGMVHSQAVIQYPRYFSLTLNTKVADSLGVEIADEVVLKQRLIEIEANGRGASRNE